MKYLKSVINIAPILLLFWMVGCQQGIPLNLNDSMSSFSQQRNPIPRTPTKIDFPSLPPATVPSTPSGVETFCASYTVKAENIIAACRQGISLNAEGLGEVAPNCESSFLAITPRVGCTLLVSQLNNAIGATGCQIVFNDPALRSYLPTACAEAYQQLFRP